MTETPQTFLSRPELGRILSLPEPSIRRKLASHNVQADGFVSAGRGRDPMPIYRIQRIGEIREILGL